MSDPRPGEESQSPAEAERGPDAEDESLWDPGPPTTRREARPLVDRPEDSVVRGGLRGVAAVALAAGLITAVAAVVTLALAMVY